MDDLEHLWQLRDEADQRAQVWQRAGSPIPATSSDPTGSVTVAVDGKGIPTEIQISTNWQARLDPEELGPAIQQAITQAGLTMVEDWFTKCAKSIEEPLPPVRPMESPHESVSAGVRQAIEALPEGQSDRLMNGLTDYLTQFNAGIDAVMANLAQRAEVQGTGRLQGITVTLSGNGQVNDIDFSNAWLSRSSPRAIANETLRALQLAREDLAKRQDNQAQDSLLQLASLSSDPTAMVQWLTQR